MGKTALVTGVTGQDGSYLAELLLNKGYEVHGIKRRSSSFNTDRIDHLYQDPHEENRKLILHYGDLTDSTNLIRIVQESQPDEIYNLAAQSHVAVSFETPEYTANADGMGPLRILEAIRLLGMTDRCRFYQASTSELYGLVQETPQNETTPFYPRSPYAAAKLYAYWITVNYREAYGIYACNGILFNHESPQRGETFVTRKITRALARIRAGLQSTLYLGNMDSKRDWGHARDFVEAQWLILQQAEPDDYVVATGELHSVREFVEVSARALDFEISWEGTGVDEVGRISAAGETGLTVGDTIVRVDPRYFRPTEVELLLGDYSKAKQKLGWTPKIGFQQLVDEMTAEDLKIAERDAVIAKHGYQVSATMSSGAADASPSLRDGKIYVAGHRGMAGSSIVRRLQQAGCENLLLRTHAELDLTNQAQVDDFMQRERPDYVFLAAARVGGIYANNTYPGQFAYDNLAIALNVIKAAQRNNVQRLLFLGSSCIYPRLAPQPMAEDQLLTGGLEPTNEPYAIAKIAGIKLCESFNREYGTDFRSVMPTNLYGPNDNFDLETSHVLPALVRKFHEAREQAASTVEVWGTGKAQREFLHVDDLADAACFVMDLPADRYHGATEPMRSHLNVGTGTDVSIAELANIIKDTVGFAGDIVYNTEYPDGAPRKLLDVSLLKSLGWQAQIDLREGIRSTYEHFKASA